MDFVSAFITQAAQIATSFGTVLSNAVTSITSILWDGEGLTIVGACLALAMGVGVVYLIFRMIRGLVKQNNRG